LGWKKATKEKFHCPHESERKEGGGSLLSIKGGIRNKKKRLGKFWSACENWCPGGGRRRWRFIKEGSLFGGRTQKKGPVAFLGERKRGKGGEKHGVLRAGEKNVLGEKVEKKLAGKGRTRGGKTLPPFQGKKRRVRHRPPQKLCKKKKKKGGRKKDR